MTKTPKAYRDDLAKDFGAKRKDTNEKIKRIQENPDFLESHKKEAIKVVKDNLYKELDDARGTEEYKDAKSKKQTLREKKKDVKKKEDIIAEQERLRWKAVLDTVYKTEKKESKETLTKSLEFEDYTFKIDSTLWKETKRDVYNGKPIKVKENTTGDVVEYLEGPAKGEQIFITYDAFIREVMRVKNCSKKEVEKKYLMTVDELREKMKDKPDGSDEYKKFFNKEVNDHLASYWKESTKRFYDIGVRSNIWLAGGYHAFFNQNGWDRDYNSRVYGFSGRLLKN